MEERVEGVFEDERSEDPGVSCGAQDLAGLIAESFDTGRPDIRTLSALTLAFLGDYVFDLVMRTVVVGGGNSPVNILHRQKSAIVKASAQADMVRKIEGLFSPEEEAVYKRGRNATSHTVPKNADVNEYRMATGLEALIGYLYLQGRTDRILELIRKGRDTEDA
ncbi:MAG: ribonuclease III [Lachnospiraceae bacterium]|nr:ribonuclease III [Lachnospiraceae bacterium]